MHAQTLRKHNASSHYVGGGIKIQKNDKLLIATKTITSECTVSPL